MDEIFLSPYKPEHSEEKIYKLWLESGFFNPDVCIEKGIVKKDADYFSIVLPPPNVTGTLHIGGAYMLAVEDIMVRYHRMRGKKTLWIPGTDHAAIATQSKVEKLIQKEEGRNRHELGREELLKRIEKFAEESRNTIIEQTKKTGASLDWSREAFTLDEKRSLAVRTVFKKMYDDGIIYRGFRVVNWDPKGQTTISDDEIVYQEEKTKLYTFKYSEDFPISISTTRPETKIGDVAVAVNPGDARYKQYIGKEYDANFAGEKIHIKIVADTLADPEFGTGAVGLTPAHSIADFEAAQRCGLPLKQVINEYAKMITESPLLRDKKTKEARDIVVGWLKNNNLLEKEEEITHHVATAERTGGIIEPLPKLQWFVAVDKEFEKESKKTTLKKMMLSVVDNKEISILPDRFEKVYIHWIENLRDWCISRQIWYGHQIPVWYRNNEIYVGVEAPHGPGWEQDPDTLDTWFSSGLWTFSTLGWPEQTEDLKNYHPTTVLETGYDILFFWVARMILMSTYVLGDIPFKTVYLHGLVRDKDGKKISKSLGNNIDPVDIVKQSGADALRMALIVGVGPGADSKFDIQKVKAYKLFANKIWNITRFVLENTESYEGQKPDSLVGSDVNHISYLDDFVKEITADMENFRFYLAGEKLYHYVWHTFADKIIEESKEKMKSGDPDAVISAQYTLRHILRTSLILLHPFMPFITEEIWPHIKNRDDNLLLVTQWPS